MRKRCTKRCTDQLAKTASWPALPLDPLVAEPSAEHLESKNVEDFVSQLRNAPRKTSTPVGEGEEVRADTDDGVYASALYLADDLVHGSAAVAV